MDLSRLLSPPESKAHDPMTPPRRPSTPGAPSSHHFTRRDNLSPMYGGGQLKEVAGRLPSPPTTPATALIRNVDVSPSPVRGRGGTMVVDQGKPSRDPVLFPHDGSDSSCVLDADQPLFPEPVQAPVVVPVPASAPVVDPKLDEIVTHHMAMHMDQFRSSVNKPTRDEYLLALSCIPIVSKRYAENPRRWLQQERRILDEHFSGANRVWKKPANSGLAKIAPAPATGVKRQAVVKQVVQRPRVPRAPRAPKQTPPSKLIDAFERVAVTTTPKRVIGTSREDVNFDALPDYSPPLSTLPKNQPKVLKADWRGQMLDLSNDPNRHLLHEAELHLASTLRLSCATYLCSKRRIFIARLEALRIGKEFRKTDSQQACKIDVNKASKLWTAYDRVGWFKPEYFDQYLQAAGSVNQ